MGGHYKVSRITSKKALDMAAENHLILKQPGKGSFITEDARKICKKFDKKEKRLLAVIQPDLSEFFGLKNFLTLEQLAHKEGYILLTGISNKDVKKEKELITNTMNTVSTVLSYFPSIMKHSITKS